MTKLEIVKTDFVECAEPKKLYELGFESTCSQCIEPTRYVASLPLVHEKGSIGNVKIALCKKHWDEIPFSCLHKWSTIDIMPIWKHTAHFKACSKCDKTKIEVYH